MVGAEPLQRVREEGLDGRRTCIEAEPSSLRIAQRTELDAQDHLVAIVLGERLADQELVVPHAVVVPGVEQGHARVQRGADGRDAFRVVGWPIEIGHAHAPEADRRHHGTRRAQLTALHASLVS
jgi:hypothetical protein